MDMLDAEWSVAELHERERRADEYRKRVRWARQTRASRLVMPALQVLTGMALLFGWGAALVVLLG